jgi:OOP family OmpA-OmpF porin
MNRTTKSGTRMHSLPARFTGMQGRKIILLTIWTALSAVSAPLAAQDNSATTPAASQTATDPFTASTRARNLALDANAPRYAGTTWLRADKEWSRMGEARENSKQEKALEYAAEAQQLFSAAELEAIQNRVLETAHSAIEQAIDNKAKRYAPLTLEQANKLVTETEQVLQADRYAKDRATRLAGQAARTARHASQIALIAAGKPTVEDLILQWDGYFARLQTAAGLKDPTATVTAESVGQLEVYFSKLRENEVRLRGELATSQAFNASLEAEIRELDQRLGNTSDERQQLLLRLEEQARAREQFDQVLRLFGAFDALVLRQTDDIVIRLIGLRFASGSPKLSAGNSGLLKNVEAAIAIYPDSTIVIEGHTDSRGSNSSNKLLSEQRAQTVANYLAANMGLRANRLTAVGFGAEKPIANNETDEGREKNRRIDVVIKPKNGVSF